MTRREAIESLIGAWLGRDSEFLLTSELPASEREMREAFHALGVTDEEIDA